MEHQSFGSTRLVLSLLVEETEGALVRISPAPLLFCADHVPGLVLSALHGIAHVILTASLGSGWHYSSHFTGKETETSVSDLPKVTASDPKNLMAEPELFISYVPL